MKQLMGEMIVVSKQDPVAAEISGGASLGVLCQRAEGMRACLCTGWQRQKSVKPVALCVQVGLTPPVRGSVA